MVILIASDSVKFPAAQRPTHAHPSSPSPQRRRPGGGGGWAGRGKVGGEGRAGGAGGTDLDNLVEELAALHPARQPKPPQSATSPPTLAAGLLGCGWRESSERREGEGGGREGCGDARAQLHEEVDSVALLDDIVAADNVRVIDLLRRGP